MDEGKDFQLELCVLLQKLAKIWPLFPENLFTLQIWSHPTKFGNLANFFFVCFNFKMPQKLVSLKRLKLELTCNPKLYPKLITWSASLWHYSYQHFPEKTLKSSINRFKNLLFWKLHIPGNMIPTSNGTLDNIQFTDKNLLCKSCENFVSKNWSCCLTDFSGGWL